VYIIVEINHGGNEHNFLVYIKKTKGLLAKKIMVVNTMCEKRDFEHSKEIK
jgi:hypothetical protein